MKQAIAGQAVYLLHARWMKKKRGSWYGKLLAPCQDAISEERLLGKENREAWVGSLKGGEWFFSYMTQWRSRSIDYSLSNYLPFKKKQVERTACCREVILWWFSVDKCFAEFSNCGSIIGLSYLISIPAWVFSASDRNPYKTDSRF